GYQVSDITLPEVGPTPLLQWAIAEQVQEVHREFRARGEKYGPDVLTRIIAAEEVTAAQAEEGRRWQLRMRDAFATAFQQVDLLVTPTVPVRAKVIGEEMIGDRHYRAVLSYFSAVVNHAQLPAIAMPLTDTGAPPLSLQA